MHLHHQGASDQSGNRRDVAHEIEVEPLVERCVDGICRADQQQRVAVRERFHHRFGADVGTRARPVLNDEGLAEPFRQPLAHQACGDVGRATGRESDDQSHRPRWICLRSCNSRCRERSHSGSGEICKSASCERHALCGRARVMARLDKLPTTGIRVQSARAREQFMCVPATLQSIASVRRSHAARWRLTGTRPRTS